MSFPCDCVWEVQGASLLLTESIKQHFVVICVLVPPPAPRCNVGARRAKPEAMFFAKDTNFRKASVP